MKKAVIAVSTVLLMGMLSGCSFNHPVAKDYGPFLQKNANAQLPHTTLESDYQINGETENHRYEFRAATVGYAHLWIVEFGKILDQTLNAAYVQESFGRLDKAAVGGEANANLIEFELEKYEFTDYRAHVTMRIRLSEKGKMIIDKPYSADGNSQGGQMWGAGPFGMKNATLDSTKSAIDSILTQFINELPKH